MAMDTAEKHKELEKRMTSLINNITQDIYRNVTRGLFGKDKILFSFMISTSINREAKIINEELWSIFAKGPTHVDKSAYRPNPSKKLFSDQGWELANYLEINCPRFTGLL
jgi:dynein heavy chain